MPRPKSPINYQVELDKIDGRIQRYTELINGLNEQKQGLLNQKRDEELKELYQFMIDNGLTAQDVLNQIEASPCQESIAAVTIHEQASI